MPAHSILFGTAYYADVKEGDVIAVLGADGTIRYASPAVDRILGQAEGSLRSRRSR